VLLLRDKTILLQREEQRYELQRSSYYPPGKNRWLVHLFSPKEIRRRPLPPGIARFQGENAIDGGHYDTESPASTGRTLLMEAITT
jgi:hypothetical protein